VSFLPKRLAASLRLTLGDLAGSDRTTLLELLSGTARFADGACDTVGNYVLAKGKMMLVVILIFMGAHLSLTFDSVSFLKFLHFFHYFTTNLNHS